MSTLSLLVGLPGIGKTTYAKERLSNAVRVCHDDIYRMVSGSYKPEWRAIYHHVEDAVIAFALDHGFDVVIDRTNITRDGRKRFIDMGRQHGATVIAVVLPLDVELAADRNVNPERLRTGEAVPDRVVWGMYDDYQEPHFSEGFDGIIQVENHVRRDI